MVRAPVELRKMEMRLGELILSYFAFLIYLSVRRWSSLHPRVKLGIPKPAVGRGGCEEYVQSIICSKTL